MKNWTSTGSTSAGGRKCGSQKSPPSRSNWRPRPKISDVCQRKGCWTVLSVGEDHIRVRFKDYAFFLPTDSSGKQAYVEGYVKAETLSEETAQHYASESSEPPPEPIVGPQQVVGFTASGVRLLPAD